MKQTGKRVYNNNFFMFGGRPPFYSDLTFYSKERIDEFVKNKLDDTGDSDAYLTVDPTVDIIDLEKYKPYTVVDGWDTVTFKTIEGDKVYRVISNKTDLDNVRNGLSANYILDSNIEFSVSDFDIGGDFYNSGAGFAPIGNSDTRFIGIINGNGKSIKGLYINKATRYTGLIGFGDGFIISNLSILESNITGIDRVACFVGNTANGLIANCFACCNVNATERAGMFIGQSSGTVISNCYAGSGCKITCPTFAGGLAGYIFTTTVTNCFSACELTSGGGLIGNQGNAENVITSSFWDIYESRRTTSAGGVGYGTLTIPAVEMKIKSTFENAGWDFETVWNIDPLINDGYPYLRNLNGEYVSPFGTLTKIVVTTITIDENNYVVFPVIAGAGELSIFDRDNPTLYTDDARNSLDYLGVGYGLYWRVDKLNTANILSWMQPDYKFSWFVKNTFTEGTFDAITIKEIMSYNAPITGASNLSKMMKYLGLNIWFDSQDWDDDEIWID